MREIDPEPREWAQKLLYHEANARQGVAELVEAADQVCVRLREQLSPLIGLEGMSAVLRRAVRMSQDDFEFLKGVEVPRESNGCLKGLREGAQGRSPNEVRDGLVSVIGHTLWLLVTFVGRDLTLRQLRRMWPGVALESTSSSPEEAAR